MPSYIPLKCPEISVRTTVAELQTYSFYGLFLTPIPHPPVLLGEVGRGRRSEVEHGKRGAGKKEEEVLHGVSGTALTP